MISTQTSRDSDNRRVETRLSWGGNDEAGATLDGNFAELILIVR